MMGRAEVDRAEMDTVRVAPREITDVVARCCRVRGFDTGVAQQIGLNVTAAHLQDGTTFNTFAATARAGELSPFATLTSTPMAPSEKQSNPYRDGVEVDAASWHDLYEMSAAYLVSAELLDSFVEDVD